MRASILAIAAALALGACLEEDAPVETVAPGDQAAQPVAGPPQVDAQIDWEAARTARSASTVTDANVSIQSVTGGAPPSVPMLLPSGVVQAQNAAPPAVVTTDDGYFATYHMPRYDAIVNGTKSAYGAGVAAADKEVMKFTTGEASAQLAFSRFGADYLIEFECRELDGADSCITEAQAREFAESLFVAQTQ